MEAQPPLAGWRWAELQPVAPASQLLAAAELRVCLCLHVCGDGASDSQDSSGSCSCASAAGPCGLVPPHVCLYSPGFWPMEEVVVEEEEFTSALQNDL